MKEINQNSMLYWYPKIKDLNINIPKTIFVPLDRSKKKKPYNCPVSWDTKKILSAIKEVGGFPAFLRTDQASHKHMMEISSKLINKKSLDDHIFEVITYNELKDINGLPYESLVVREWLDLEHSFKAFKGTPIAQEIRFFIDKNDIVCNHFYWPKDSIRFIDYPKLNKKKRENNLSNFFEETNTKENENTITINIPEHLKEWEKLWNETKEKALFEIKNILPDVKKVAEVFDDCWSVDFAKAKNGRWYLIDMALGITSWHPHDCPVKQKEIQDSIKKNKLLGF